MAPEVGLQKVLRHRYRERVLAIFWHGGGWCGLRVWSTTDFCGLVTIEIVGEFPIKKAAWMGGLGTASVLGF